MRHYNIAKIIGFLIELSTFRLIDSQDYNYVPTQLRIGLIANETGYGGLINSVGAINVAIEKLHSEGFVRNIKFR